jgi:hypothetical protein
MSGHAGAMPGQCHAGPWQLCSCLHCDQTRPQFRYLQVVRLFDTITGKPLGEPIKHSMEMYAISLNHFGSLADRKLLIIDRNRDLYIVAVGLHIAGKAVPPYKLGALT